MSENDFFKNDELNKRMFFFQTFMIKIYSWMSLGLLLTSLVSYYFTKFPILIYIIYKRNILLLITILQIILVYLLSNIIFILNYKTAIILFLMYSILNGITISGIFLIYTFESIYNIFLSVSFVFMFMTLYGLLTRKNLTNFGSLLLMLLFGILLSSIFNFLFKSIILIYLISYINIFIFIGLISYDTQKLKRLSDKLYLLGNNELLYKYSILGALILYLDFINLFLIFIKNFNKKKDNNDII